MKNTMPISVFMICLVVTLPIYVSSVYADLSDVNVHGQDGIRGFVRGTDSLAVEAKASIDGDSDIGETQLRFRYLYNVVSPFDSCIVIGLNNFQCYYNEEERNRLDLCPEKILGVELYNDNGVLVDSESLSVKCDSMAPLISGFTASKSTIKENENLILSYFVEDIESGLSKSSGIRKIEFYTNSLENTPSVSVFPPGVYILSNSINVNSGDYDDGTITLYLKAYDWLDNNDYASVSFIVDKEAPQVESTVTITDSSNNPIFYFMPQDVLVDIVLDITDAGGVKSYSIDHPDLTSRAPNCNTISNGYRCTWYNLPFYMETPLFSKTISVDVEDNAGHSVTKNIVLTKEIISDREGPLISVSDIIIETIDGSEMEWFKERGMRMRFSIDVTDNASGIDQISADFSSIEVISGDVPYCTGNVYEKHCSWDDLRFIITSADYNKNIKITAKDIAGNIGEKTVKAAASYRSDNIAPVLSELRAVDQYGNSITRWIGKERINARIYANIREEGSGIDVIKANFNDVNPSYTDYIDGVCSSVEEDDDDEGGVYVPEITGGSGLPAENWECYWDIVLDFNRSGNPLNAKLDFNIADKSGNTADIVYLDFYVDIDAPVVKSLKTDGVFDGNSYAGSGYNTFTASFDEPGIGLNNSDIYLDLSDVGFGSSVKAHNCTEGWECYWYMGSSSGSEGIKEISLKTDSRDDIGNYVSESFKVNVILDLTKPFVNSVKVVPVAGSTESFNDYLQIGNAMEVIVNLTEKNVLADARADFSGFVSDEDDVFGNCGKEDEYWICRFESDEIDIENYKKGAIVFNFTDVAGNSLRYEEEVEVFETAEEEGDFWEHSVGTSSPSAIDKQIVTLYEPFVWFPIKLEAKPKVLGVWPIDVSVESCSEDGSTYLSSESDVMPEVFNYNTEKPGKLPYNVYLKYSLEQSVPEEDVLEISCLLKVRTLVEGKMISRYETENVTVNIHYYNNPLGVLDENIKDEIEEVKSGWLVSAEWIGTLKKIIGYADTICRLVDTVQNVQVLMASFSDVLKKSKYTVTVGMSVGEKTDVLKRYGKDLWFKDANKYCKLLSCQIGKGDKWGNDYVKAWAEMQENSILSFGGDFKLEKGVRGWWKPEKSLILSIVFLCPKGIIYNLEKARVIDCQYINCLKDTKKGMPIILCTKQRDYAWCKYVYGEIFNLIPFAGAITELGQQVIKLLSHPYEAIGFVVKYACTTICVGPTSGCKLCTYLEYFNMVLDVMCDLGIGEGCEPIWKELSVDDSVCEDALEEDKQEKME